MDTSGCPTGLAKDRLVTVQEGGCTLSVNMFWGVMIAITILRMIVTIHIVRKGWEAYYAYSVLERRLPLSVVSELISSLIIASFFILSGIFGSSGFNSITGVSSGVLLVGIICAVLTGHLAALKFVNLGSKILPKKFRGNVELSNWTKDNILAFAVRSSALFLLFGFLLSFLIFAFPRNSLLTHELSKVALFLGALSNIAIMGVGIRQMNRIIKHLDEMMKIKIGIETQEDALRRNKQFAEIANGFRKTRWFWGLNTIQSILLSGPLLGLFEFSFVIAVICITTNTLVILISTLYGAKKHKKKNTQALKSNPSPLVPPVPEIVQASLQSSGKVEPYL